VKKIEKKEEQSSKQLNDVFNEITIIIWNVLLLNGGAVFTIATIYWLIFPIKLNILVNEAMYLITLMTWWLSIFVFLIHLLMFLSDKIYYFVKNKMPSHKHNILYENIYIISSFITPLIYISLIPHAKEITNFMNYFVIINIIILLTYIGVKIKKHYQLKN